MTGSAAAGSRSATRSSAPPGRPLAPCPRPSATTTSASCSRRATARRAQRGEPPIDVEAELRALTAAPAADPELADEVRQLVQARNARRVARGEQPLDVEAEVSKRLREM